MKVSHIFIATLLMLALSPQGFAAGKSQTFKCWTNKQGVRECGNEVPPEYAQGETRTMNSRGMTVEEKRKPTKAELLEEKQKETAAKAGPADAQAAGPSKEQQAYDKVLLASYLSEQDIAAARTRKITAIDAAITYNTGVIGKLEEKLKKEQAKADARKQGGKELSDDEKKDMALLQKQIDDKKSFIAAKQKEKEETNLEYDGYLNRFRELKAAKEAK
jgi:hypothetical protein